MLIPPKMMYRTNLSYKSDC